MRVFIAIDLDEQVLNSIADLQQKLNAQVKLDKRSVKWVEPKNMHLTLKFLGEVKDKVINDVCQAVKDVTLKHRSFELSVESVGCFGGQSARVIWVGTGAGGEELAEIANDLDERLSAHGFPKETRQFTGHLTLCRIKDYKAGIELAATVEALDRFEAGSTVVDAVTVYQSELTKSGPIYTALATYNLKQ